MVLFVGDKPSKRTDPDAPFKGAACEARLMEWIACLGVNKYEIINQVDYSPSRIGVARLKGYIVIALGNNTSKFCGGYEHFKLPHPSGRNRQINDKSFIINKLEECKKYIHKYSSPDRIDR